MNLSVIIVNHNAKYFAEHCLHSVIKACRGIDAEIFVFDNNSTDGSKEYLPPKFPPVHFIWNENNIGFAKANNYVLQQGSGNYILFLNPDTIIPEDGLKRCIDFFKTHSDCGALGVKMIDGSGQFLPESKRSLPGTMAGLYKISGLAKIFPRAKKYSGYYADNINENDIASTDVLAGAFMMLSREAAERTKGFDENFFMYGEDIDLSYRVKKAGLKNYYLGDIAIIHFKGESTQKRSAAYYQHFYGAMKLFADKHYGKSKLRNVAIAAAKNIARFRSKFNFTGSAQPVKNENILIAGNAGEQVRVILTRNNFRIDDIPEVLTGKEQIIQAARKKDPGNIIFCEGALSNKDIIDTLEKLPHTATAFFHESGAESIIGSPDKNRPGRAISMIAAHP